MLISLSSVKWLWLLMVFLMFIVIINIVNAGLLSGLDVGHTGLSSNLFLELHELFVFHFTISPVLSVIEKILGWLEPLARCDEACEETTTDSKT